MKRLGAAVAVFAVASQLGLAQQPAPRAAAQGAAGAGSAEALAKALDARYRTVRDFSADFVQTYRGGALRTQSKETGTVKIRKPGLMRWLYAAPEKKEFVSDGHSIYSYFPADKQVMVSRVPSDLESTTPALFLAGKADIARDFVADFAPSPVRGHDRAEAHPAEGRGQRGLLHRGHRAARAPDPRARRPGRPGGRFHAGLFEPEGKSGNIR